MKLFPLAKIHAVKKMMNTSCATIAVMLFSMSINLNAARTGSMLIGSSSALAVQSVNISLDHFGVKIAWDVRDAQNIAAFEIQRAILRNGNVDGLSWSTIQSFPVIDGSVVESSFEYYDLDAPAGSPVVFYRIKQVSDLNDMLYSAPIKIHLVGSSSLRIASAYPNPVSVNASTTIQYGVGKAQTVSVAAYDVTGRQVAVLADGHHNQGEYSVDFSTANLNPGTYFIRLVSDASSSVQRLIVSR